ncbi:hypothetical protein TM5383_01060 [Thalassovita mediterranea]|uniref:Uncharacterized protein n=1 Tax=Thalassovita mediterranea TaxID=340021 RepID=A0A0P1H2V9_9RHOB|nr:hypothetical protein TM5383_01060 [Thalassovita mediterranea]SIS28270.1 hypothetical protein SAMN05421685_101454 [Thalassovita mediterranea]
MGQHSWGDQIAAETATQGMCAQTINAGVGRTETVATYVKDAVSSFCEPSAGSIGEFAQ